MENKKRHRHPLLHFPSRKLLTSLLSFFLNLCYVAFNTVAAVASFSVWHGALAGFYALLTLMRGVVLFWDGDGLRHTLVRKYRICGGLLLLLPLFLLIAVFEMAVGEYRFADIPGIVSIPAVYTSCKLAMAIRNVLRTLHTRFSVLRALCNISLAEAASSVLSLQGAILKMLTPVESPVANAVCAMLVGVVAVFIGGGMLKEASRHAENKVV